MLKIENNKLILSPELVNLLQATPGDKIIIEYLTEDNKITPVILKSDRGNVLSNSNTISFRGKQKESLLQFGTEFQEVLKESNIYLLGNKGTIIYTPVKSIIKDSLDKSIILDTNYNIQKFETYELQF